MKRRCAWANDAKPFYQKYHDEEWGVPVHDDQAHFELLILEGAQAGLSWEQILKRREAYCACFHQFDPQKVAVMTNEELETILKNPAIIRNRKKVFAARQNAQAFLKIQKEFGSFNAYVWPFVGGSPKINHWKAAEEVPCSTPESLALSKELKKRGMTFVGPTILYSYMQAAGLVCDHTVGCFRYQKS